MTKFNEENERIKRRYLRYLMNAEQKDVKSVDKAAAAIFRFEESTKFKPFKLFHIDQAITFKRGLEVAKNERTGKPLSKATIDSTLRLVKAFVYWLASQSGYRKRISYPDCKYFNPSAKDARIAHAVREVRYPSLEQAFHAFSQMPNETDFEQRDKAIFAFVMLTAARDGAIASLTLKRIDLVDGCVYQDARDVKTKGAKTFTTWFMPVDPSYLRCFEEWVNYLRQTKLFGPDDALFPKPEMGMDKAGGFAVIGLSRDTYSNGHKVCQICKRAFVNAGLFPFTPHGFRKTLVLYGDKICLTREAFKAWSVNIGHSSMVTTVQAYMPVSSERQKELIKGLTMKAV